MNPDNLREIIEVFESLGGSAKDAFIAYLIAEYGSNILCGVMFLVGIVTVGFRVEKIVKMNIASERLRNAAGVSVMWSEPEICAASQILSASRGKSSTEVVEAIRGMGK